MNTINTRIRITGIVFSILMSTAVLGTTVLSMQPAPIVAGAQVVALERVTVSATAVN